MWKLCEGSAAHTTTSACLQMADRIRQALTAAPQHTPPPSLCRHCHCHLPLTSLLFSLSLCRHTRQAVHSATLCRWRFSRMQSNSWTSPSWLWWWGSSIAARAGVCCSKGICGLPPVQVMPAHHTVNQWNPFQHGMCSQHTHTSPLCTTHSTPHTTLQVPSYPCLPSPIPFTGPWMCVPLCVFHCVRATVCVCACACFPVCVCSLHTATTRHRSVINALLGKRFLPEGILPTTNEISILKFDDAPGADSRVERQADGLFVRFLPSRMLEVRGTWFMVLRMTCCVPVILCACEFVCL